MQSKTSYFNKTIFKKNLTRFAPVWGVYTLCLILGILLLYTNGGTAKQFHFANNMAELIEIMAVVNLGYGLLVAQLLFGDLYNSRMCNMLHAFPLKRESWFFTNVISGFVFSLVPTAVMAILATPLLMGSLFTGAWKLAWWVFLAANLQFVCFFGIAVFSAMCVANRFTMVAGYGLLNAGAYIVYWLIDTVYTPMLYGVITPTALMNNLTPMVHMTNYSYIDTGMGLYELREKFGDKLEGAFATFTITEEWWRLWVLAAVGLVFLVLALVLYRKRDLECAGDAVAFRILVPVFQVLCAIFVATGAQFFLYAFMGVAGHNYLILSAGLIVGWFVGKMLLERTTRVFRVQNWYGLAALAAVFAVSLWMTHVDILGIESRMPSPAKIKSVSFSSDWTYDEKLTRAEDIEAMLRLQELALEERAEDSGMFVLSDEGEWIHCSDIYGTGIDDEGVQEGEYPLKYATVINLRYELENGKLIRRRYNVWVDGDAGSLTEEYLSRWEHVNSRTIVTGGKEIIRLDWILENFKSLNVDYYSYTGEEIPEALNTREAAESLIAAIQADCEAGTMAQHPYFHHGHFRIADEDSEKGYYETSSVGVYLRGDNKTNGYSVYFNVYADCENTLRWLEAHDLLKPEIRSEDITLW